MMLIMLYQKLGMKPSAIFLKRALKYSHTKLSEEAFLRWKRKFGFSRFQTDA